MGFLSFFSGNFLGVKIWIWFYFALSILMFGGVMLYWHREKIKKIYYKVRFPEKLLKVVVHYPSNLYKVYWRVIPTDFLFELEDKKYVFDKKGLIRKNILFVNNLAKDQYLKIGKRKYNFDPKILIKSKGSKYPEIHYFFNNPHPITYDQAKHDEENLKLTSQNLKTILENDLLQKLLSLKDEKKTLFIILVLCAGNLLATGFIILNDMGVFEGNK